MDQRRRLQLLAGAAGTAGLALAASAAERAHLRRIAEDPEQAVLRSPPTGRPIAVRSADGTQLHAEEFAPGAPGRDSEPQTFVLIHGWTETIPFWTYVIRELRAQGFRVLAYDLRGHGDSEPASGGEYAIARFGEDLEAVLDACLSEGERAIVVGHSLGAMSIAAWAERHDVGRRASAAGLLNTGVGDLLAEHLLVPLPWLANILNRVLPPTWFVGSRAPMARFSTPVGHAAVRHIAFGPTATPAQVAFYEQMLVACPPDVRADVGLAISEIALYDALPRLTVPTLVLAGELDRLTPPSHARRIAEQLPLLHQLLVLPRTGHMAPLERPQEVCAALVGLAAAATAATSSPAPSAAS